jgi:peptide/nickel transport system ATP-binding protein
MTAGAVLSIRDLSVEYRHGDARTVVVPEVSFDIMPGESYGLVGESGCGKTTTALAVMGYLGKGGSIARGSILLEGEDLVKASPEHLRSVRGRRMGMVYQEPSSALNPTMTIGSQLLEVPVFHLGLSKAEALRLVRATLEDVRMPDPDAVMQRYPHQISGGQQQRIVIAMALLARPALILLDEPTAGLDVTVEAVVLDLIMSLRGKYGTSLLFISHNLGQVAKVCDRVGVMYSGAIVEEAPVRELFSHPKHPYTQGLIACVPDVRAGKQHRTLVPIPGRIPLPWERPTGCFFAPRCIHAVPGRCDVSTVPLLPIGGDGHSVRCVRADEGLSPPAADVAGAANAAPATGEGLAVTHLTKIYEAAHGGKLVANDDLNLAAAKGEILAIVGESGCGKSTFARIVAGLDTPTKGKITFGGKLLAEAGTRRRDEAALRAVQMVFQNPDGTLNPSHSVGWPIRRVLAKFGLAKDQTAIEKRTRELFETVRLPVELASRRPSELSGGQKQRIAIARAFAANPELIVADEPVSALDVSVQAAVVTLLLDIQRHSATTMVFISHDLALVRHIADRVAVMYLGKVMEQGPVEDIFAPPHHPYTEALLSAVSSVEAAKGGAEIRLAGDTPSPVNLPKGCRFASRCPRKLGAICDSEPPPIRKASPSHDIACHIPLADLLKAPPVAGARQTR